MDLILINHAPTNETYHKKIVTTSDPELTQPTSESQLIKICNYLNDKKIVTNNSSLITSPTQRTLQTTKKLQYVLRNIYSSYVSVAENDLLSELQVDFIDNKTWDDCLADTKILDGINKYPQKEIDKIVKNLWSLIDEYNTNKNIICVTHPIFIQIILNLVCKNNFELKNYETTNPHTLLHIKVIKDEFGTYNKLKLISYITI